MYQVIVYEWYNNFEDREILTEYQRSSNRYTFADTEDTLWDMVESYSKILDNDGKYYLKYIHSDDEGNLNKVKIDIGGEGRVFTIAESTRDMDNWSFDEIGC